MDTAHLWLVVTDEGRFFEISDDEGRARRAAKAIDGCMVKLEVAAGDDYRKR